MVSGPCNRGKAVTVKRLLPLLLLGLSLVVSGDEVRADASKTKAQNFRATDLNGEKIVLEDLLGSGPILVDFWATWCKPCIKELPYIQRLHDQYAEHGLTVLAATIDTPRSQNRVKPFVKGKGYTFPVVMDGDQDVFRKLQGKGTIPYVVVIDPQGYIRYRHTGYKPGDEIELEKVVVELFLEAGIELPAIEEPQDAPAPEEATG